MTHDAETVERVKNAIGLNAWGKDWPPHQTETLVHDMYERMARAAIAAMPPQEAARTKVRSDAINEFAANHGMKASEHVAALPEDVRRFRALSELRAISERKS